MNENGEKGLKSGKRSVKAALEEAKRSRRVKQALLGTLFIGLVVAGWFYSLIGYFIPLCMVAGVGLAAVRGRKWCNWMCPRGSFADTYMKAISPGRNIPGWLKGTPVRLAVLALLMAMLAFQILRLWPDPYAIGRFFVVLLTVTTVVGVFMALFLHQRAWCSICPIGSLSSWVGKSRLPLNMDRDACVSCGLCTKACPMQLAPQEMKENEVMADRGDCLKCGLCTKACPKSALSLPG